MARIFTEDFEGGTAGALLTTANTGFSTVFNAPTFTDQSLLGNLAMQAQHQTGSTAPMGYVAVAPRNTLFMRAYVARDTAAQMFPMRVVQSSPLALRAIVVVTATGQVRALNPSYGSVTQNSTVTIPLGEYARVEWGLTATTQQIRLFVGDNIHGTVPDYDSGPATWAPPGTFDQAQFGNTNSEAVTLRLDEVAVDDSTWPGPVELDVPVVTPWRVRTEQGWAPASMHIL